MTEDTRTIPSYRTDIYGTEINGPDAGHPEFTAPGSDASGANELPPSSPPAYPDQPRRRRGVTTLIAVALAAGLIGGGASAAVTHQLDDNSTAAAVPALNTPVSATKTSPDAVEQVASRLLPSVVSIQERAPDGSGGEGTGVILSADGLILTNNHVVANAANGGSLSVTLNDGSTTSATIVGRDPVTDLAVVRAKGVSGLRVATLGRSSDLRAGESVVAIGSPLGLQGTVTSGIVSALNRPVRTGDAASGDASSTVIDAVQTDAAINPGNSGGPLVNLAGQVVGINSAIATLGGGSGQSGSIGVGFSIPIDQARWIAKQLIDSGHATHAQLGVSVRDALSTDSAGTAGAYLAAVTPGGGAQAGGLQAGDIVTKVDDRRIDGADSLIAAIRSHRPGHKVQLTYVRGGKIDQTAVTLGNDATQT
jgi:putative serine protease PepD